MNTNDNENIINDALSNFNKKYPDGIYKNEVKLLASIGNAFIRALNVPQNDNIDLYDKITQFTEEDAKDVSLFIKSSIEYLLKANENNQNTR